MFYVIRDAKVGELFFADLYLKIAEYIQLIVFKIEVETSKKR